MPPAGLVQLRRLLTEAVACYRPHPDLAYRCPEEFVLEHGHAHRMHLVLPVVPRHCFANAILMCEVRGWRYVEGYALVTDGYLSHAWCLDGTGRPVEVTWPEPALAYLGVEFSVGRADDATWFGDSAILQDGARGWPVLRQRWTGEDFARTWRPSPVLEKIRAALDDPCLEHLRGEPSTVRPGETRFQVSAVPATFLSRAVIESQPT